MAEPKITAATLGKVVKLLELADEKHQQTAELLTEARTLLAGDTGIGDKLKAVERAFDAAWCERYAPGQTGRYVWAYVRDVPQIKRLLKVLGADDLALRAQRYIGSDDPFYAQARHPFGLFVTNVNRFAAAGESPASFELSDDRRPYACVHVPACKSDAAHTARRNREMREVDA